MADSGRPTFNRKRVEERVRSYMAEEDLWPSVGRLLVAVSGGPDSSALLLLLRHLAGSSGRLAAAHFDHRLRGPDASAAEHDAVRALTDRCEIELVEGCVDDDLRETARRQHRSLEQAARHARYDSLGRTAASLGCSAVATGHTLDDQAETVIMHVVRGSGLRGIAGMAPRSTWPTRGHDGLTLVRPLLGTTHTETVAYCAAEGYEPAHDDSNDSTVFARNRVRHELMPALRSFNPDVASALGRLATNARHDLDNLDALPAAFSIEDGAVRFELGVLRSKPVPAHYGFRAGLVALLGDAEGFGLRHYRALESLAFRGQTGDLLELPRTIIASRTRSAIVLTCGPVESPRRLPDGHAILPVPGEVPFGALVVGASHDAPRADATSVELDAAAVGGRLTVRARKAGDRIELANVGTKKLQDLLVDAHIPGLQRDSIPVFENERGIVWVGGVRAAGWALPRVGAPTVVLSYRPA